MPQTSDFLPFHAINEFMRPDFRLSVIRETLSALNACSEDNRNQLNKVLKKRITVPGFRNSEKAPAIVRVIPTSKAFEKYPDVVAEILSCWVENHTALRDQVFELLKNLGWQLITNADKLDISGLSLDVIKEWPIFPVDLNRAHLPGFSPLWPKGEDFETIYKHYSELYPDSDASIDKVSLMVVWLSMRLPYHFSEDEK